ncbi:MAG: hypothetical protein EU532_02370 [Promethearchaeota archaeon]|nr:MAG: hypothetical protein EU532_02370 [Candidatus Lokiarchaeota archaeon]
MTINVFQFDWIFIDTVVIILLIFFLVCVKIFKESFRWRSKLSNNALFQYKLDSKSLKLTTQNNLIKNVIITNNKVLKKKGLTKPIIFFIGIGKNRRLLNILTEGLASYGFNVINMKLNPKLFKNQKFQDKINQINIIYSISAVIDFIEKRQIITNSPYFIISLNQSPKFYDPILFDKHSAGMILIDPKFNFFTRKTFSDFIRSRELKEKITFIFSKKSKIYPTPLNQFLKYFSEYEQYNLNLLILENSKNSFKFYETILLGIVIYLVEVRLSKKT